jgi:hypothetical protein
VEPAPVVLLLELHEASRRSDRRHSGASVPSVGWNAASLQQLGLLGIGFLYLYRAIRWLGSSVDREGPAMMENDYLSQCSHYARPAAMMRLTGRNRLISAREAARRLNPGSGL